MNRIWQIANTGLVLLGVSAGYRTTSPEGLSRANPDAILCAILLILMPVFALGTVYYSLRWNRDDERILGRPFKLRRPSLNRNPVNWWGDPLQSLFISMCYMGAMAIGASFRRPAVGSVASGPSESTAASQLVYM
jgi:hypothetical protein